MRAATFDTWQFGKRLKAATVPEQQAQVQVLTADAKINLVRKDVDLVRKDMEALENRLVIKLGKMFVIGVGLILAAIGLAVRYLAH